MEIIKNLSILILFFGIILLTIYLTKSYYHKNEILKEENIKNSKDYKNLIVEINGRIDSEMKVKKIKEYSLQKSKELEKAKKELNYLQSLVKNKFD